MKFATIPDHLALIVTEVLKNALRATVEFHTMGNSLVDATTRGMENISSPASLQF